jgi:predicted kinase
MGIVVLSGPPCAGKSSVGKLLAADGSRVYVEVDGLFSLLFPESDRNRQDRMLAYDAAHHVARGLANRGLTPILECTYARAEQRAGLTKLLAGTPLWVVELEITPDEAIRRFRNRPQATDLDEELLRERVEHFPYGNQGLHLQPAPPADLAAAIDAWLQPTPKAADPTAWAETGRGWS